MVAVAGMRRCVASTAVEEQRRNADHRDSASDTQPDAAESRASLSPQGVIERSTETVEMANGYLFYPKGAALDDAAIAIATVTEGTTGAGRFRLRGLVGPGGSVIPIALGMYASRDYPYFDSVAGEDCQPIWMQDGKPRCVPASVKVTTYTPLFTDPACAQPSVDISWLCDPGSTTCDPKKVLLAWTDALGRLHGNAAYTVATRLDSADIYSSDSAGCHRIKTPSRSFAVLGQTLALDTFPTLTERHPLDASTP